jgi:hypothetical protein
MTTRTTTSPQVALVEMRAARRRSKEPSELARLIDEAALALFARRRDRITGRKGFGKSLIEQPVFVGR